MSIWNYFVNYAVKVDTMKKITQCIISAVQDTAKSMVIPLE